MMCYTLFLGAVSLQRRRAAVDMLRTPLHKRSPARALWSNDAASFAEAFRRVVA